VGAKPECRVDKGGRGKRGPPHLKGGAVKWGAKETRPHAQLGARGGSRKNLELRVRSLNTEMGPTRITRAPDLNECEARKWNYGRVRAAKDS